MFPMGHREGCNANTAYMKQKCAPACQSCDYVLELYKKCGLDPDGVDAMEKGGMDELFDRMVRVAEERGFEPTIHSRPLKGIQPFEEEEEDGEDNFPWVITLENFVSSTEMETLMEWGSHFGYDRSQAGDTISETRTSSQAWCFNDCYDDPIVKGLRQRIHEVTGIPEKNYEALQLLHYDEGQFYKPHDDFIRKHVVQGHGPRLLTFFMYFNEVEEGGGTRFPKLNNLTIQPRPGRVLIWPSVLDEEPYQMDGRTEHEALEVVKGEKYAANAWIHMRDFQTTMATGCPS
eukprot:g14489.t1 g14489   contig9:1946719-1947659(+)